MSIEYKNDDFILQIDDFSSKTLSVVNKKEKRKIKGVIMDSKKTKEKELLEKEEQNLSRAERRRITKSKFKTFQKMIEKARNEDMNFLNVPQDEIDEYIDYCYDNTKDLDKIFDPIGFPCICGENHKIRKSRGMKKITCSFYNIEIRGMVPKVLARKFIEKVLKKGRELEIERDDGWKNEEKTEDKETENEVKF